ncbi:uncharacterized protein AMSG_03540 [Thecamonas trahens ATCC 50062]|uniref:LYR motif-containing protein Cup1-like N-terminal domain-containing protein n=1 Tax=Thecamonas trahens ATCC 50062 TaxID=461836 RepID=A0A0L0D4X5_THETB|nr:hypothetical protein AMSG_03540 [Thecamonas trahens ATCC 50062]KNC47111.1 hypothetical protein AMSG_03540 [Thecamonas trahens ATCC 50062]|eukprot:XP_013759888.1 hypothetical protein AMSG_03540 [Thecamonas trahens ATCC 50062]
MSGCGLYRSLLRAAVGLFDARARMYAVQRVRARARAGGEAGPQAREGRKALRYLRKAVGGDARANKHILALAYGSKGRVAHLEVRPTDVPVMVATGAAFATVSRPPPPPLHPLLAKAAWGDGRWLACSAPAESNRRRRRMYGELLASNKRPRVA